MKRRNFCRYVALSSAGFVGGLSRNLHSLKSRHRWVILYWMPYDNDLVRFGEQQCDFVSFLDYCHAIARLDRTQFRDALRMDYGGRRERKSE